MHTWQYFLNSSNTVWTEEFKTLFFDQIGLQMAETLMLKDVKTDKTAKGFFTSFSIKDLSCLKFKFIK